MYNIVYPGHHHYPIWYMIPVLVGIMKRIRAGGLDADIRKSLETLRAARVQAMDVANLQQEEADKFAESEEGTPPGYVVRIQV